MVEQEQALPSYPPSNAKQQTKLATAAAAEVAVTEDDIPGATLGTREPEELKIPELKIPELKIPELKCWLVCRGVSQTGLKPQLAN